MASEYSQVNFQYKSVFMGGYINGIHYPSKERQEIMGIKSTPDVVEVDYLKKYEIYAIQGVLQEADTPDPMLNGDMVTEDVLKKIMEDGKSQPVVLFNHDPDRPIGKLIKMTHCIAGHPAHHLVHAEVEILKSEVENVKHMVKNKLGYFGWYGRIIDTEEVGRNRIIKDIKMINVSLCTRPASKNWDNSDVVTETDEVKVRLPKDDENILIIGGE